MRKFVVGSIVLAFLLVSSRLLLGYAGAAERARPIRIGALTDSWGPTPQVVGLRDGLVELGYREHEDFVLGVRFTQGDLAALFAAARDLVQNGLEIIFADGDHAAKAAQRATTRIPIVFVSEGNPVETYRHFKRHFRLTPSAARLRRWLAARRSKAQQGIERPGQVT